MKKLLIIPFMFLLHASNGYASSASVDKLFEVMAMEEQMNGGFEAMLPVIDQMAQRFKLDSAGKEELKNIYRAWFDEDIDRSRIMEQMKVLYTDYFTENEISEVTKFYQTEVGQKFLRKSPQLMQSRCSNWNVRGSIETSTITRTIKTFFGKTWY